MADGGPVDMTGVAWVCVVASAIGMVILACLAVSLIAARMIRRIVTPVERAQDVAGRTLWPLRAGTAAVGICIAVILIAPSVVSPPIALRPHPSAANPSSVSKSHSAEPIPTPSPRRIVWSDEFDGPAGALPILQTGRRRRAAAAGEKMSCSTTRRA